MRYEILDGWYSYSVDSVYNKRTLSRLAECSWDFAPQTFIGDGVTVAGYEQDGKFHALHWCYPFMHTDWIAESRAKLEKYADKLDILCLIDEKNGGGSEFVHIDIKDSVEDTIQQYRGRFGKKVRKVFNSEFQQVVFTPMEDDDELQELMVNWQGFWNSNDENHKQDTEYKDLGLHFDWFKIWREEGVQVFAEGIRIDGQLVGGHLMMIDRGIAHGLFTPWRKDEFKGTVNMGYLNNLRRIELCCELGVKDLVLGSSFGFEQKSRWNTSPWDTGSIGGGLV